MFLKDLSNDTPHYGVEVRKIIFLMISFYKLVDVVNTHICHMGLEDMWRTDGRMDMTKL